MSKKVTLILKNIYFEKLKHFIFPTQDQDFVSFQQSYKWYDIYSLLVESI